MQLATMSIPTVEMTRDEEDALWDAAQKTRPLVCGRPLRHWDTHDGQNVMLLEGETVGQQPL